MEDEEVEVDHYEDEDDEKVCSFPRKKIFSSNITSKAVAICL